MAVPVSFEHQIVLPIYNTSGHPVEDGDHGPQFQCGAPMVISRSSNHRRSAIEPTPRCNKAEQRTVQERRDEPIGRWG
jgi:hypothetical protein